MSSLHAYSGRGEQRTLCHRPVKRRPSAGENHGRPLPHTAPAAAGGLAPSLILVQGWKRYAGVQPKAFPSPWHGRVLPTHCCTLPRWPGLRHVHTLAFHLHSLAQGCTATRLSIKQSGQHTAGTRRLVRPWIKGQLPFDPALPYNNRSRGTSREVSSQNHPEYLLDLFKLRTLWAAPCWPALPLPPRIVAHRSHPI